jgi:uncharacterized protein (DUF2235 family)
MSRRSNNSILDCEDESQLSQNITLALTMKRLIVCSDATWQNLATEYPNNVLKIAQGISQVGDDGVAQIIHYVEGIGSSSDFINKQGSGLFGWGLDQAIQNAYIFLCLNYEPGDAIYLFGFSRGAYTVRSLAGFIYNVGLLNRRHIRKTPAAYLFDQSRDQDTKPSSSKAKEFRATYSREVDIEFLGCLDTVGALGIPDQIPFFPLDDILNQKYQFHDTQINRRIKCARHAVAIDEKLKACYLTPMQKSDGADTDLHQIWFPGEHGCVGGGTKENRLLSDIALKWTIDEAAKTGLSFELDAIEYGIVMDPTSSFTVASMGIFGSGARVRKISDDPIYSKLDPRSNLKDVEYLYGTFDDLHESTKQRWCALDTYRPKGLEAFASRLDRLG